MVIAVIGGSGFIGREFAAYARRRGHEVRLFARSAHSFADTALPFCSAIDLFGVIPEGVASAEAVVMLAAQRPYAGFCFSDYENNVRLAERCYRIALDCGIRNIVFASSKAVYSDQLTMPWREDACVSPASLYGASKAAAEQLASWYNESHGMAIKSLRFAQVIGMGERKGYLINTLIDNALAKRQQVVFGDGSQRRQYIYIKDVCSALLHALQSDGAKGVFNIGMPGSVSNLELAVCVNDVFGNTGNLIMDAAKPMGKAWDEMCVEKAERLLGFSAQFDLRSLFEDIARA